MGITLGHTYCWHVTTKDNLGYQRRDIYLQQTDCFV